MPVDTAASTAAADDRAKRSSGWSLTAKLAVAATALCVLSVATVSAVQGRHVAEASTAHADAIARLAAQAAAADVASELTRPMVAVRTMAQTMRGMKAAGVAPSRSQLDAMAREVLTQTPELIGAYSIWEPNALDGRDAEYIRKGPSNDATGRYVSYWNRVSGKVDVEALVDYETPGANDWLDIPRRTRRDAVIEPALYPVAGQQVLMATVTSPIVIDDAFLGMVGADLPLKGMSEHIATLHPMEGSHVSLLSNGGLYVAVNDPDRLGKHADDVPDEALAHVARGEAYRHVDPGGWIHLFEPVSIGAGLAPWSVRLTYPVAVVETATRREWLSAGLTGAVACAVAALVMVGLVRRFMRPVRELAEAMERLAGSQANLSARLSVRGRDELARISDGFNRFLDKICAVFDQVRRNADTVGIASREIAQGNLDLSGRTEQQAAALEHAASSMRQLRQTVDANADRAKQANTLADAASEIATHAGVAMTQAVATMKEIRDASFRIGEIVGTIDSIAFQTNILALNAAVEAAAAAERGKGFAVVAAEVRSLAGRSAEAARAVKTLIETSVERVEAGHRVVDRAGAASQEGVASIQRVAAIMGGIRTDSDHQSRQVGSVAATVTELDQVTQQNAALVEQMTAASTSLKQQAEALITAIDSFDRK